jgi:hypothetical protein
VPEIEQNEDGRWAAEEDSFRSSIVANTKKECDERIEIARKHKAQVAIHGSNGPIEREFTYPRSSDPRRRKG